MSEPPKPGKDTVYIDAEDDITAIIDKVEGAEQKVVAMVLPKRSAALQSIVNMRLLKRSAKNASKNVVLITSEAAILPLAGAAGVHVAKSLQSKPEIPPPPDVEAKPEVAGEAPKEGEQKIDGSAPIGELAAAHESIDLDDEDAEAGETEKTKQPKDKRLKIPNFERFRLLTMAAIAAGVLLVFLLIFGIFVWPRATITISTESTPVSTNFNLDATDKAKALDTTGGVIPASVKTSDQTGSAQAQATGQQNNGTKASGSVAMTAQKCSGVGNPSDVPAGTGVTAGGLTYITQSGTSFHFTSISGGCANFAADSSTAISAQSPGAKYNVGGGTFSVAGRSDVSASGSASGGTDNIQTILSQSDVDNAKQKAITSQGTSDFTKNFQKQLEDQGLYVIVSTMKAGDPQITATPGVGQPASTSNVTIKITFTVLTVQKADLATAIKAQLNKQIDTSKQKISSNDVVKDAAVTVQSQPSPSEANLQISESTTAIPTLDLNAIKKKAGGLKSGDIKSFVSDYPGVKSVNVKFSPFWVSKAPKKPAKVHIVLQQVKSTP